MHSDGQNVYAKKQSARKRFSLFFLSYMHYKYKYNILCPCARLCVMHIVRNEGGRYIRGKNPKLAMGYVEIRSEKVFKVFLGMI